ncbi:hypothetical protein [Streptomyces parvulus]|uniref:hypothetical protein n=1 Tax=Streptomyces parvulus TaxID=146923 RepID=UPI0036F1200E
MTSDRPTPSRATPSIPTPPSRRTRTALGRVAAITAGATLGLGALVVPAATASGSGTDTAGRMAPAVDSAAAPTVTLGAATVKPGGDMAFSVSGFPAGQRLSVKLDDATLLGQFTLDEDGSFSGSVSLPAETSGAGHWLRFLAPQTSVKSGTFAVVAPAASLGTTSAKQGGEVPFTVTGFPAGQKLSVKLDDSTLLGQFTLGSDGSFSGRVTLPADAPTGPGHWLRFLAPQTSVKSGALSITAADRPAPDPKPEVRITGGAKVAAGGSVSFSLTGFTKGQTVTVKLDDEKILGQWQGAVRSDGTFSGKVTVPKGTSSGGHWLRFLAPDPPTTLRADITVTSAGSGGGSTGGSTSGGSDGDSNGGTSGGGSAAGGTSGGSTGGASSGGSGSSSGATATITANSRVAAGGKVSFRVTGFPAGERLTVKLDDAKILGQWEGGIGADGSFSGSVTVPDDVTRGAHWLRFLSPNPPTSLRADFTVTEGADPGTTGGGAAAGAGTTGGGATPVPAASGAPAAASNSRGAKAEITASRVQPGGKIHFKVTNFPADRTVTIKLDDEDILGQWKTDAEGNHEDDVTIPADVQAGAHWLRFLAPDPPTTLKVDFTVTAADGTGAGAAPAAAATSAPGTGTGPGATAAVAGSSSVSYATIGWSAAAAAAGGAAGAAVTSMLVVRRRTPGASSGA